MTDQELIDFVAARLPTIIDRVQYKPRCWLCREAIIAELARNPLFAAIEREEF